MQKRFRIPSMLLAMAFLAWMPASAVFATNGDNLIAVGPIARSMGGVGIAAPQDAISAVFANPAAMCFGPYCPTTEADFAGTLFMPDVSAKITNVFGTYKADSDDDVYAIPAFGLSVPISDAAPFWRFGLAAFGVSGLGVDYRETALDTDFPSPPFPAGVPLAQGTFTALQKLRFAPSIAFQPNEKWSFGLAALIDYANLDLQDGSDWSYGFGAQAGLIYKATDNLSLGFNIQSPINVTYEKVAALNIFQPGVLQDLDLETPMELGIGAAYTFLGGQLLVEGNAKWIDWSGADGYSDFGWRDQYIFAIGAQYQPIPGLFLRAGYNYGRNPVEENSGFNGTSLITVQGNTLPRYYYETFRIIGFPAIVENHLTLGIGYEFSPTFSVNVGYVHGFEETIKETGTDISGNPVTLESTLKENSIDFELVWRF